MALDGMLIDGEWTPASDGATLDVVDPTTEEVIGTVPEASPADLDRALDAARRGFASWREVDAWTRSATLRRVAVVLAERVEAIAGTMTAETGKPLAQSRAELASTVDQFDWYADEARRIYGRTIDGHSRDTRLQVLVQPVGPVAAFTAWNFPALLPARKIAPALAAGCSIVVKPAEEAPRTLLAL
nr:aldehyde dehydrogenase family protein [Acidimicrobiales bacterium]